VTGEEEGEPAYEVTKEDRAESAAGPDHERDRDDPALRAAYPIEGSSMKV
jgi:hypothetical protein